MLRTQENLLLTFLEAKTSTHKTLELFLSPCISKGGGYDMEEKREFRISKKNSCIWPGGEGNRAEDYGNHNVGLEILSE